MIIKHAMILAAGLGKRMQPLSLDIPKPLLKVGSKNLLDRAISLLIKHGVKEFSINVHYLSDQIKKYISNSKSAVKITISNERDSLLDTGGGVKNGTKHFKDNPFFIINPDTLWRDNYLEEVKSLERMYLMNKSPCLLVVNKELSFDKSFKGDFNLKKNKISRDIQNNFIFTGLQIMHTNNLNFINKKIFSLNEVWNKLIDEKTLYGIESSQKFYHLNTFENFKKISLLKSID